MYLFAGSFWIQWLCFAWVLSCTQGVRSVQTMQTVKVETAVKEFIVSDVNVRNASENASHARADSSGSNQWPMFTAQLNPAGYAATPLTMSSGMTASAQMPMTLAPPLPTTTKAAQGPIKIVFMRHGNSMGNKMAELQKKNAWGQIGAQVAKQISNREWLVVWNAVLSAEGLEQPKSRLEYLAQQNLGLVQQIAETTDVLVSPLRRTLGTTVLAYHTAWKLIGIPQVLPSVHILNELREKYKSISESNKSPYSSGPVGKAYVDEIGNKLVKRESDAGFKAKFLEFVESLGDAVEAGEKARAYNKEPKNPVAFIENINSVKRYLYNKFERQQPSLFIVGHSGWAKYAFAHLLPDYSPETAENPSEAALWGNRYVKGLNNAGVLALQYDRISNTFGFDPKHAKNSMLEWDETVFPEDFPNFGETDDGGHAEPGLGVFADRNAAIAQGLIPPNTVWRREMLGYRWDDNERNDEQVMVTISAIPNGQGRQRLLYVTMEAKKWGERYALSTTNVVAVEYARDDSVTFRWADENELTMTAEATDGLISFLTQSGVQIQLTEVAAKERGE